MRRCLLIALLATPATAPGEGIWLQGGALHRGL